MPVWLGLPEYTEAINAMASGLGVEMCSARAGWLRPWFVSGNPPDPFCGWPPDQPGLFSRQMRRGGIAGVLMGHASEDALFSMGFQNHTIWYDTAERPPISQAAGPCRR